MTGTDDAAPVAPEPGPGGHVVSRDRLLAGTRWMAASQISVQGTRMLVSLVLARLLVPEDFGLVAMAFVVVAFLDIFMMLGTGAALVQRAELTQRLTATVFYFNLGLGSALGVGLVVLAPWISTLYREPDLTPILRVMAIAVLLSAVGFVQQALLRRAMQFGRVMTVNLAQALVNAFVAIGMALAGAGPWALVGGTIAGAATASTFAWSLSRWRPSFEFSRRDLRSISAFSLNLSASRVFNFFVVNADKVIIGRFLGVTALGYYALAQRILTYPVQMISQTLQDVLFPAFSRVQDDDERIREAYLRALGGIALVTFPMMFGIAVVAGPFVDVVLGEAWRPAVTAITILAPVGALQSLVFTVAVLYQAKARTDLLLWWSIGSGALGVAALFAGLPWGIEGVAAAYGIVMLALTWPAFAIPFRLIGLRFAALLVALRPYAVATAAMAVAALATRAGLEASEASSRAVLVAASGTGALAYGAAVWALAPPGIDDLRRLLRGGRHRGDPVSEPADPR